MKKLYEKSEIWFAILWIAVYVAGSSLADSASEALGIQKAVTLPWLLVLGAVLWLFVQKNGLQEYYGFCKAQAPASRFGWYAPLAVLACVNIWFGVKLNFGALESLLYVLSMLAVGFLEELIFRGLLFRAMAKDGIKSAIIVSSLTFGLGHIVNLLSGAEVLPTLCQLCYAAALGFLFCILVYRGGSIWPCILTHGALNALSAFSNEEAVKQYEYPVTIALTAAALAYSLWLLRSLPKKEETK